MESRATTHPADETLVSYGLGKLDDTLTESVGKHIEQCEPCRRRVAELSSDSFLGRLQDAKPSKKTRSIDSSAARPKTLVEEVPADSSEKVVEQPTATALPTELREHPQYEVIRELGRGGMGVVYLARNKLMDRLEVLKVLSKELLAKEGRADRFLREIQSAAKLHHPNVVAAYAAFPAGDLLVFAMEYVEGEDLGKLIRSRGPLPVLNACYFAYQAAQGLQHAHERGMIHRDIKPGNLILLREGKKATVKILDFGLAKVRSEQRLDRTLTQAGQMLGTPDYIAPEQTLDAQKADIRADIYSLGCTLYHLLTGQPPFSGNSLYEVLQAHHAVEAKPLNLVRPEVPAELAAVVAKMLAKEPERRYQTPAEVAQALKPFLKPGGLNSPPVQISQVGAKKLQPNEEHSSQENADDDPAALSLAPMEAVVPAERWKSLVDLPAFERSSAIRKAVSPVMRQQIPWKWPAVAAALLLMLMSALWASGVFRIKTKEGVIVLKSFSPEADVFVDGEKAIVTRSKDGTTAEISVASGTHQVVVKKGDLTARGEEVTLASGGREEINVSFQPVSKTIRDIETPSTPRAATQRSPLATEMQGSEGPMLHGRTKPNAPQLLVAPFDASAARKGQEEWHRYLQTESVTTNQIGMKLTFIPPGEYQMGAPSSESNREINEWQHLVRITKPFYLGIYEVTQSEFQRMMERNPSAFSRSGDQAGATQGVDTTRYPVEKVSWYDAVEFCNKLSEREARRPYYRIVDVEREADGAIKSANVSIQGGNGYRLPTEVQWEYACRAGTTSTFDFGTANNGVGCNCDGKQPYETEEQGPALGRPAPVGSYQPNAFGLYDMHGNVWEWCEDVLDQIYYWNSPLSDPAGPAAGPFRVTRGGCWRAAAMRSRAAQRNITATPPELRYYTLGFRVAYDIGSSVDELTKPASPDERRASQMSGKSPTRHSELGTESSNANEAFVPLFNGKDFTNWTFPYGGQENWKVENGVIQGKTGQARLVSARSNYRDFQLRMEIRSPDQRNKFLIFRASDTDGDSQYYSVSLGGLTNDGTTAFPGKYAFKTGGGIFGSERLTTEGLKNIRLANVRLLSANSWHIVDLKVERNTFALSLDGKEVSAFRDDEFRLREGQLIVGLGKDAVAEIRKIEIKELMPRRFGGGLGGGFWGGMSKKSKGSPQDGDEDAPSMGAMGRMGMGTSRRGGGLGSGMRGSFGRGLDDDESDWGFGPPSKEKFVSLFNGQDFTNWTFPKGGQEKWTIEGSVLRGEGRSRIATARSNYKDFHLRMQVRTSDQTNKHLIFRSHDDNGQEADYRFHLGGIRDNRTSTWPVGAYHILTGETSEPGEQPWTTRGLEHLKSVQVPLIDDEKWHRVEIKAKSSTFQMILDDRVIAAFRDVRARYSEGQIAIGLVEGAHLEIRDIEINETTVKALSKKSSRRSTTLKSKKRP